MRLAQVSTVLAAIAIGLSAIVYVKVDRLESGLLSRRADPQEGIRDTEAAGGGGAQERRIEARDPEPTDGIGTATPRATASRGSASDETSAPASLEERIARLEEKARRPGHMPMFSDSGRYARNVDDLAKQLSLTPTQRTRIEDAIARGRQRIDDILKIPDETGKSPYERRAEARKKIEEAMKNPERGGMVAFATDLMSHLNRKIPGRNDTYADEIDRVRKETREEIAGALDAKQRETFQETNTDALLGESSQVSFAYTVGGGPGGESAEMIVEMGSSVETEADPAPADGK